MPETMTRTEYAWEITRLIKGDRKILPTPGATLDQMRADLASWGLDWQAAIVERTVTTTTTDWTPVTEDQP